MKITQGYTFDDLLLVPKYSEIRSRNDVDLKVNLGTEDKPLLLDLPVICANMKSTSSLIMVEAISKLGGLGLLHRFMEYDIIVNTFKYSKAELRNRIGCSVGVQDKDRTLVDKLVDVGCKIICVDVAHGASKACLDMTTYIASKYSKVIIISGNVATGKAALSLYDAGATVIKGNVGSGSLCSTRIETGNGVPTMTALEDIYKASLSVNRKFKIICDGGIRRSGDVVKGLVFSDAVMIGSLLAGTDEAPSELVSMDGKKYKTYAGSSTFKTDYVEGVSGVVPYVGPVAKVIEKLMQGLRSGCSYQGVSNLEDLKKDPEFVSISNSGLVESHPHDVKIL